MLNHVLFMILLSTFPAAARAIVLDPMLNTAEAAGYQVAGEFEFRRGSVTVPAKQVRENLQQIYELCPRTQSRRPGLSQRQTHFVLLAWADREFPGPSKNLAVSEQSLALLRAQTVAQTLRRHLTTPAEFELVNMAHSQVQRVRAGRHKEPQNSDYDIKSALRQTGAAPASRLESGLFGEYGQRSKVVVWVDCAETFPRGPAVPQPGQLAHISVANLDVPTVRAP